MKPFALFSFATAILLSFYTYGFSQRFEVPKFDPPIRNPNPNPITPRFNPPDIPNNRPPNISTPSPNIPDLIAEPGPESPSGGDNGRGGGGNNGGGNNG